MSETAAEHSYCWYASTREASSFHDHHEADPADEEFELLDEFDEEFEDPILW